MSDAFGSSRPADLRDLARAKALGDSGIILGRLGYMPRLRRWQAVRALFNPFVGNELAVRQFTSAFFGARHRDGFIRLNPTSHLLTVSPTGGGKTINSIAPCLLSNPASMFVVDFKGEHFFLSAQHRRKTFGQEIIRLDPWGLCGPGADCFNAYDWLCPTVADFLDSCRELASDLVVRTGTEHEPHFNDSAEGMIAAITAYICACEGEPEFRNLRGMRTILASRVHLANAMQRMQGIKEFDGVLQQLGEALSWHQDREFASVMTTTNRHTNIFDSPLIAEGTRRTSFDPDLRSRPATLYLVVPGNKLQVWGPYMRAVLGSLLRIAQRGVPTETNPLLFIIDEAANLGKMPSLETAITLGRGSGIRIWLFMQSLAQLRQCFGDNATTVLDNMGVQQYFGIQSLETAEYLSKRMGDYTLALESINQNDGTSWPTGGSTGHQSGTRSSGRGWTRSEHGRPLFRQDEILRMPESQALVFTKNLPVILAERIVFYSDPAFRKGRQGYGTGRTRGLGLGAMVPVLLALLVSAVATGLIANLTLPRAQWRAAVVAVSSHFNPETARSIVDRFGGPPPLEPWQQSPFFDYSPYQPGMGPYGGYPVPYRRGRRSYP